MSMLSPEIHTALSQLLTGLQSPDNVTRSSAEESLNNEWVVARPETLLAGLVELVLTSGDISTRSFAAVLFRRMATRTRKTPGSETSEDLFWSLGQPQKHLIRAKLLECLANERESSVRHKISDAVAEIARQYTSSNEPWSELLAALFQASQSNESGQREAAFRIFATTPDIIGRQHEEAVLGAFTKGFKDSEINVRLAAMEAFSSFFRSINKKSQQKYYSLIPNILNILPPVKDSKDNDQLTRALIALIDLAEVAPKMFKPLFHDLVRFSIDVVKDKELDDQSRQNALELMATFADYNPVMCKKDQSYTTEMVTQCLSLMTDVGIDDDDAKEWNSSEDLDIDESDMNHVAGEQCMDRLANKLGGQALLPPTFNWLPRMMNSTAWRDRHASLMAISAISEGCRDHMIGELNKVLELVIPALQDPHPRVRWAGCNALGQMSTDFAGTMQEKYHQFVLPAIIPVLESPEPRVQSHAAAALVNFCEEADKELLEPYLDTLLSHLLVLLQSDKRFVQEQALSTIATVADSAEVAFSRYYDTLMPLLFNVLREEQSKEYRLLRAKAMECATLIALAVGKDRMNQDAIALVQLLGNIQQNITESDDPQASYLLHCWGRMCQVLGQDFLPYLPGVIPPLVELASAKADIQLLDDEEQVAQIENEEGWELLPVKGKFIGIRTTTLDDKNNAIELIAIYARHLEAGFEPYVLDIMDKIALPSLEFFFHEPVRVAAAKAIPQLLNAYKKAHGDSAPQVAQLWTRAIEHVLGVLCTEPAIETLAEMYQCFYESVDVMGKGCLTNQHMSKFIESSKSVLEDFQVRVKKRAEEAAENRATNGTGVQGAAGGDGEYEEEDQDEDTLIAIEDDQQLLSDINKAFHTVMRLHTTSFLPYWEHLLPYYNSFINDPDASQRQWAICILDDVLEFCGEQSWTYSQHIITPLIAGIQDPVPANRQAAAYGAGVAAQKGGQAWSEFSAGALPLLFDACRVPGAREDDHVYATENACASIAKICHFNSSKVQDLQGVVDLWVDTLPVLNDEEAAPYAYTFLATLIEQGNQAVTRAGRPEAVFSYVARALEAETIQESTANRVVEAVKSLARASAINADAVLNTLEPDVRTAARAWFS